jgi:hypothetical protein
LRTLVIGLDCAAPEILFTHPGLKNLRELMGRGCSAPETSSPHYGSGLDVHVHQPGPWLAWAIWLSQSHGFSYSRLGVVTQPPFTAPAIWDVLAAAAAALDCGRRAPTIRPGISRDQCGLFLCRTAEQYTYPPGNRRSTG